MTGFRASVEALIPALRAFARSLTNNRAEADDLVQESLMKAWANRRQFRPGSNLRAWLFTIIRNTYYTSLRHRKREVEDASGWAASQLTIAPDQEWTITVKSVQHALRNLPAEQGEALVLVAAAGFTYEEAAEICGCALGTIKSRVHRGRARLLELLDMKDPDELNFTDVFDAATPH